MSETVSYETDFHAWALRNARLLREGQLTKIDAEHIAEELEGMSASARRELLHRLQALLAHLLKYQFQCAETGQSGGDRVRRRHSPIRNPMPPAACLIGAGKRSSG